MERLFNFTRLKCFVLHFPYLWISYSESGRGASPSQQSCLHICLFPRSSHQTRD